MYFLGDGYYDCVARTAKTIASTFFHFSFFPRQKYDYFISEAFTFGNMLIGCLRFLDSDEGLEVTHMVSIGGWNAPHPHVTVSGKKWWRVWQVSVDKLPRLRCHSASVFLYISIVAVLFWKMHAFPKSGVILQTFELCI